MLNSLCQRDADHNETFINSVNVKLLTVRSLENEKVAVEINIKLVRILPNQLLKLLLIYYLTLNKSQISNTD